MFRIDNSRASVITWSAIALICWGVILTLFAFSRSSYIWLGTEDEFGENMTSFFYFGAGLLVFIRSLRQIKSGGSTFSKELLSILLALFFIFVGGEEISWGQRLFGITTPDAMREANVQGEITIHNLSIFDRGGAILNQHTALNVFTLLMGIVFPILYFWVGIFKRIAQKVNFPIVPLACCIWFFVGLVHGQSIAKWEPHWSHAEVKELIFSVGFFLFAVSWFKQGRSEK